MATISGTSGSDVLIGTDQGDVIYGRGNGNDTLIGGGGDDFIFGSAGNDVILAGSGNDWMNGGLGRDQFIFGNPANGESDRISFFQTGIDRIVFQADGDILITGFSADGITYHDRNGSVGYIDTRGSVVNVADISGATFDAGVWG